VVSLVENVMATVVSLVALLAPVLTLLLMGVVGWLGYKGFRRLVGNGGRTRGRAGAYSVVEAPRGRVVATGAPPVVATPPMS
jgi:hypothetical protein